MERNLALDLVRVTEAAAIAAARTMGRGDAHLSDDEAVKAMRNAFSALPIDGVVVIGEGELDLAPMLYIGERVGCGGPEMDIALDPLEGTGLCAFGRGGAISVVAMAQKGGLMHAPDMYMRKLASGPAGRGVLDINKSAEENLLALAKAKNVRVEDLTVVILDRSRHSKLIKKVRQAGARIRLIPDGDVHAAIATCDDETGIDLLLGIGGAPEGVLAASALLCMGGEMQSQLIFRNDRELFRAQKMMEGDVHRTLALEDMAKGRVLFAATGVTSGEMLPGVRFMPHGCETHSLVMRARSGTIRELRTRHLFESKPMYGEGGDFRDIL